MEWIFQLLKTNTFVRNSAVLFAGTMVVNVLNYVFHLIVGRMVSPAEYGEIESLVSVIAIISVPAATIALIATKYAAEMRGTGDVVGTRSLIHYLNRKIFWYGLPVLALAILCTPLVKGFLKIQMTLPILFLWGVMLLSFLNAVTSGILTGQQNFKKLNVAGISLAVVKLGIAFVFVTIGFGVSGVMGSYMLSTLIGYLIMLFFLRHLFRPSAGVSEEVSQLKGASFRSYILPAFYGSLAIAILGNADMIFAKHHLDATVSGEYGALSVAAKTIFFVTGVITTVLFAMSAEKGNDMRASLRTFLFALGLTVFVVVASILFFFLFPKFVLSLLFGATYLGVSSFLVWFAVAAGLYSLSNLILQYLLSLHETRAALIFLALASLEIGALFFFGETLRGIIGITIFTQIVAILGGGIFIAYRMKYAKNDLDRHPSL